MPLQGRAARLFSAVNSKLDHEKLLNSSRNGIKQNLLGPNNRMKNLIRIKDQYQHVCH